MSDESTAAPSQPPAQQSPIVAGFDRSDISLSAAELAASEAQQRGLPLELVHAFTWPWIYPPLIPEAETVEPLPRIRAIKVLTDAATQLRRHHPEVPISSTVIDGPAPAVLVDRSAQAALLVIGHRGAGGFAELLAGSTAIHTAAHARCPILVTRGAMDRPAAPVIVGLDGSPDAHHAARFAFLAAALRGVPVVGISVWPPEPAWPENLAMAGFPPPSVPDLLAESLTDCTTAYPEVAVHTEIVRDGSAAGALIHAAEKAALVVVGSRGLGGLRGMLLGSVGRALIEHAPCPVAIVRTAEAAP
jgi:nucleotide-binding universal stress UspA family protein